MAVPRSQEQYVCLTSPIGGLGQYFTPIWTGIRVRPEGGMFDPLTNNDVTVLSKPRPSHIPFSTYETLLYHQSQTKAENCIYLHDQYFVETRCTFRHWGKAAIQCACEQGKYLLSLEHYFPHCMSFNSICSKGRRCWWITKKKAVNVWPSLSLSAEHSDHHFAEKLLQTC